MAPGMVEKICTNNSNDAASKEAKCEFFHGGHHSSSSVLVLLHVGRKPEKPHISDFK